MSRAKVTFHRVIQDTQDLGGDDEHMISRVDLDLEVHGKRYEGLHATVKQPAGSSYDAGLEVSMPAGYDGPFDYEAFRNAVENYYRDQLKKVVAAPAGAHVRMRDNVIEERREIEFDLPDA